MVEFGSRRPDSAHRRSRPDPWRTKQPATGQETTTDATQLSFGDGSTIERIDRTLKAHESVTGGGQALNAAAKSNGDDPNFGRLKYGSTAHDGDICGPQSFIVST